MPNWDGMALTVLVGAMGWLEWFCERFYSAHLHLQTLTQIPLAKKL